MSTPTITAPVPTAQQGPSITVTGPLRERYSEILTPEAIAFLAELHHRFASRRHDRLADRMRRRFEIGNGHDPRFREDTAHIREDADWRVAGAGMRRIRADHDIAQAVPQPGYIRQIARGPPAEKGRNHV